MIRTRASDFANRDFQFEVVFTLDKREEMVTFGIGDDQGKCVKLQVNAPDSRFKGAVGLWKHEYKKRALSGNLTHHGPHRVIMTKKGDAMTFVIDVNNDGSSSGDMERTVADFRKIAPYLNPS